LAPSWTSTSPTPLPVPTSRRPGGDDCRPPSARPSPVSFLHRASSRSSDLAVAITLARSKRLRSLGWCMASRILRNRPITERVVLLGGGPLADLLVRELWTRPHCILLGVVEDVDQLAKMIKEDAPDRIILAGAERRGQLPFQH